MPVSTTLGSPRRSALISALIHAGAIVLVLVVTTSRHSLLHDMIPIRDTPVYLPRLTHSIPGGGGGGQQAVLPVPKGQPPKPSPRVFTMPVMMERITHSPLEMPPEALAPAAMNVPEVDLAHIGSLSGQTGPMSGGPGNHGGLGPGSGPGAGPGNTAGIGDDSGVSGLGGAPRKNATKPVLLSQTEPEYSEEARKAKIQGTVALSIVVTASGQVSNIRVLRSLGLGLDERAMEAVRQWKFRPGTVDGKPAPTTAMVEVNFRLL